MLIFKLTVVNLGYFLNNINDEMLATVIVKFALIVATKQFFQRKRLNKYGLLDAFIIT